MMMPPKTQPECSQNSEVRGISISYFSIMRNSRYSNLRGVAVTKTTLRRAAAGFFLTVPTFQFQAIPSIESAAYRGRARASKIESFSML